MPEGDTIFRAARTLHRALAGQVVTRFETQYAQIARVHDDAPITGRTVERVESRGKHLLIYFSGTGCRVPGTGSQQPGIGSRESGVDGSAAPRTRLSDVEGPLVLRTHMLMSGSWHIYRTGESWQRSATAARVVVGTAAFVAVGFAVPIAEFVPANALEEDEAIRRLGPDVLSPDFDAEEAVARLAASARATVAEALLEQRAVAGIGNVFKSELLFLAGLWPFVPPADVTEAQWTRMMRDARVLLKANVIDPAEAGVLTWRGTRRTTGRSNPAQSLYVYGRQGRPCRRCGTAILLRHHGEHNRSTYWCPHCQAAPSNSSPDREQPGSRSLASLCYLCHIAGHENGGRARSPAGSDEPAGGCREGPRSDDHGSGTTGGATGAGLRAAALPRSGQGAGVDARPPGTSGRCRTRGPRGSGVSVSVPVDSWVWPVYLDTSAFVKLFVDEPESDALNAELSAVGEVVLSDLAMTELASALARRSRESLLTSAEAKRLYGHAERVVSSCRLVESTPPVQRRAARLLLTSRQVPLRTLDAIHLALAIEAECGHARHIRPSPARGRCNAGTVYRTRLNRDSGAKDALEDVDGTGHLVGRAERNARLRREWRKGPPHEHAALTTGRAEVAHVTAHVHHHEVGL